MPTTEERLKKVLGTGVLRTAMDFLRFFHLAFANHIVSKIPSYYIRRLLYKYMFGMRIGRQSHIQMGVRMYAPHKISIGDNCSIGNHCLLDGRRGITIDNNVDLAGYVKILTLGHDLDDPEYKTVGSPVHLMSDVSVFTGASILPGVTMSAGSVLGLDSVLTRSTEPWSIYAGSPAKFVRVRKINHLTYRHNYKRYFH